ncbi:MAG: acyl-CoA dehydrogenase family protein [Acidimicrobiia bacterium]
MSNWRTNVEAAAQAMDGAVIRSARHLASDVMVGGRISLDALDGHQQAVYDLAFLASEAAAMRHVLAAHEQRRLGEHTARRAAALLLRSARTRIDGRQQARGLEPDAVAGSQVQAVLAAGLDAANAERVLDEAADHGDAGLSDELRLAADVFRRFGEEQIIPVAQDIHRTDGDVPEGVIVGLGALGAFGLSIPVEYGGSQDRDVPDHLAMVVATEELSRASLGIGGSLITRPEILARALVKGGTEEQKRRWLPSIASGDLLVAVAVTEPNVGSDVASIRTEALPREGGYALRGAKMWCTFAGRAELLMVLARTDPDPTQGYRGLSLVVVEKEAVPGHAFRLTQVGGGLMEGRAIPTMGYRGMHSFEVSFHEWRVPREALVGGDDSVGRGFPLQMAGFENGRLQTAARAIGVMQRAYDEAAGYAAGRSVFGQPLSAYQLTRVRLGRMAATIQACRQFTYRVARDVGSTDSATMSALIKAYSCRAAEWVSRDAMQIHGGYGYAEEYPVSRVFVDARVLSIFEGTDEVLALKIIGRQLLGQAVGVRTEWA